MRLVLAILIIIFASQVYGQDYKTKTTVSEKVMKSYRKGQQMVVHNDLEKALQYFDKAIEDCPSFIDAYIKRGDVYNRMKDEKLAEADLLKVVELDPLYSPKVLHVLSLIQWRLNDYDGVIKHTKLLLNSSYKSAEVRVSCQTLLDNATFVKSAIENPLPFDPKPMPKEINTANREYLPSFSADEEQIIFCRVVNGQEDFYMSEKRDGAWLPAQPISNINSPGNEAAHSVTAAGDLIVFTACDRRDGFGSCDLYSSEKIDGRWTPAQNMGSSINTSGWDTQPSLSSDGKYLYFASKRSGGQGGSDIYVCKRFEDGIWSKPVNLGPSINTKEDEASPFLHPDGKTLYFMSKGYPGMGGFDLYMSRQEQPFKWGPVKNLGYPINTKGQEGALFVSLDGKKGYYSHADETTGSNHDIYEFEMPDAIRPDPVTYVKGLVYDANSGDPIQGVVELYPTDDPTGSLKISTNNDGTFLLALPLGVNYSLNVAQTGYTFYSDRFELAEVQSIKAPFILDIPLKELKVIAFGEAEAEAPKPEPIILKNVFFESASSALRPISYPELDKLYQLLLQSDEIRIQINGHTDDVGDDESNLVLSEQRAKAVYQFLKDKGIRGARISYKGFGETQPIADNSTEEGRSQNRRTEFIILQ